MTRAAAKPCSRSLHAIVRRFFISSFVQRNRKTGILLSRTNSLAARFANQLADRFADRLTNRLADRRVDMIVTAVVTRPCSRFPQRVARNSFLLSFVPRNRKKDHVLLRVDPVVAVAGVTALFTMSRGAHSGEVCGVTSGP